MEFFAMQLPARRVATLSVAFILIIFGPLQAQEPFVSNAIEFLSRNGATAIPVDQRWWDGRAPGAAPQDKVELTSFDLNPLTPSARDPFGNAPPVAAPLPM